MMCVPFDSSCPRRAEGAELVDGDSVAAFDAEVEGSLGGEAGTCRRLG